MHKFRNIGYLFIKTTVFAGILIVLIIVNITLLYMLNTSKTDIKGVLQSIIDNQNKQLNNKTNPSLSFVRKSTADLEALFIKNTEVLPFISTFDAAAKQFNVEIRLGSITLDKTNPRVQKAKIALNAKGDTDGLVKLLDYIMSKDELVYIEDVKLNRLYADVTKDKKPVYNMYTNLNLYIMKSI